MSAVIRLLYHHQRSFLGLKRPWAHALVATSNSRCLSTDPGSSAESNKQNEKKRESLDEFTKSIVEKLEAGDYTLPHPIWSKQETEDVTIKHRKPQGLVDWTAYAGVTTLRLGFDLLSGYKLQKKMDTLDERAVLSRCIFLETVAGVPGFAAGMMRHLQSLRKMERDHGWIHTLLEEAENERMHLMTFMQLRRPGIFFRAAVISTQIVFTLCFCLAYSLSPRLCHRFVGYLEEQAVITYTDILEKIDEGKLPMWRILPAPEIAVNYWKLGEAAMMRDVILAIRADENHHRSVNHTLSDIGGKQQNPYGIGK